MFVKKENLKDLKTDILKIIKSERSEKHESVKSVRLAKQLNITSRNENHSY